MGYIQVMGEGCIRIQKMLERPEQQEVCKISLSKILDLPLSTGENLKIGEKIMTITGKGSDFYDLVDEEKYYRMTKEGLNEMGCDKDFPKMMYYPKGRLVAEVI